MPAGERQELVLAEVRLDLQERPERAALREPRDLDERRLEALLVSDAEPHAVRLHRIDRPQNVGARERQRLLAEDVLTGVEGSHGLLLVAPVRRQHGDGVNVRSGIEVSGVGCGEDVAVDLACEGGQILRIGVSAGDDDGAAAGLVPVQGQARSIAGADDADA